MQGSSSSDVHTLTPLFLRVSDMTINIDWLFEFDETRNGLSLWQSGNTFRETGYRAREMPLLRLVRSVGLIIGRYGTSINFYYVYLLLRKLLFVSHHKVSNFFHVGTWPHIYTLTNRKYGASITTYFYKTFISCKSSKL